MWLKHLWLWILVRPSTSATLCVFCRGGRGTVHWTITICMTGMRGKTGESFCLFVNKKSWISQNSKVFLVALVYHINCFFALKIFCIFPEIKLSSQSWTEGRYDRKIRKEGHCYSERNQRGGGCPRQERRGILSPQHKTRQIRIQIGRNIQTNTKGMGCLPQEGKQYQITNKKAHFYSRSDESGERHLQE